PGRSGARDRAPRRRAARAGAGGVAGAAGGGRRLGARGGAWPRGARVSGGLRALPHPEPARLAPWVARWRGCPVVVWGDFVLDEYWRCRSSRVSREAPVLVLDWERREAQPGGAANAALNLAAMGATVAVAGLLGDDAAGEELRRALAARGIDTAGLIAIPGAHTVVKVRVTAGSAHTARQQVGRVGGDRG